MDYDNFICHHIHFSFQLVISSTLPRNKQVEKLGFVKDCDSDGFITRMQFWTQFRVWSRLRLKCDGTRAETRFRLSAKRTSPFKSAGASVPSNASSWGARISGSNAGYNTFRDSVRVLATHSIRQFPLHFPSRASPCGIRFQTHYILTTARKDTAYQTKEWLTKGQSDSYVEGSMSYHVREWKTALSDTYIESKNTM